jgi:hypothetical protein
MKKIVFIIKNILIFLLGLIVIYTLHRIGNRLYIDSELLTFLSIVFWAVLTLLRLAKIDE